MALVAHAYANEKGDHYLAHAIRKAGFVWVYEDGTRYTNDPAGVTAFIASWTLDDAKTAAKNAVSAVAKSLRDTTVAKYSPGEMAAWTEKEKEANAYEDWVAAGSLAPTKPATPYITGEATAAGVTEASVAARVLANAAALKGLEGAIAGVATKHKAAIDALTTYTAIDAYDYSTGWPALPGA